MDQLQEQPLKVLFVGESELYKKLFCSESTSRPQPDPPIGAWMLTWGFSRGEKPSWQTCAFSSDGKRGSHEATGRMASGEAPTVDAIVFLGSEQSTTIYCLPQDALTEEFKNKPLIFVQSLAIWNATKQELNKKECKQYEHLDSDSQDLKQQIAVKLQNFYGLKSDGRPLIEVRSKSFLSACAPSKYCCSIGFFTLAGVGVAGVAIAGALGIAGVFTLTPLAVGLMAGSLIAAVLFLVLGLRNLNASESKTCQK